MRLPLAGLIVMLFAAVASAQEQAVALKDGAGRDIVEANCGICHSLDYPRINAPFLDRAGWEAEVNKMIKAYGAPVAPSDAKIIVDYLAKNYGASR